MNAHQVERFVSTLTVGKRCQVRISATGRKAYSEPMYREVTFVGSESRKEGEWIVWRWKAEGTTPEGRVDCGYSGFLAHPAQQVAA